MRGLLSSFLLDLCSNYLQTRWFCRLMLTRFGTDFGQNDSAWFENSSVKFTASLGWKIKHLQQVAAETGRCYREHLAGDVPDRRRAVRMQLITGYRLMGIGWQVIMKDEDGDDIIERGKTFEESADTDTVFSGEGIRSFACFSLVSGVFLADLMVIDYLLVNAQVKRRESDLGGNLVFEHYQLKWRVASIGRFCWAWSKIQSPKNSRMISAGNRPTLWC